MDRNLRLSSDANIAFGTELQWHRHENRNWRDEIMNTNRMDLPLAEIDPEIAQAIENEERRQHEGLELIASRKLCQRGCAGSRWLRIHQ